MISFLIGIIIYNLVFNILPTRIKHLIICITRFKCYLFLVMLLYFASSIIIVMYTTTTVMFISIHCTLCAGEIIIDVFEYE